MRLIDADKLIKHIEVEYQKFDSVYDTYEVLKDIKTADTVDAVPVIRCKDCKWWVDKTSYRSYPLCADYERSMNADDFCSRAERKEE